MPWSKEEIYQITAEELKDGLYVNLGIGMLTHVANYIPQGVNVIFQSENGMLGMGPFPYAGEEDPDLINAGKQTITAIPESSYFDSSFSFGMIRGSHVDLTILCAMQVSQTGDLANWTIPGKMVKGMGGAMDLVANTKRVVIIMEHNAKDGGAKLLKECNFPLTGKKVVNRVITDLGIFDIDKDEMILVRQADDVTIEEIKSKTEAEFIVNL
ncbi:3-oxoacid CoA-transferase, B subunit [Rickettsia parkeri str. Tate's Hell]|uniref:3-oxoacid CoA-transferase, B subunit n=1 Tax=Rickettsia parkeri str. Tate's Hell TaxID=1359189 RepID=A0ABR5DS92_RICPA|nr:3-oxoacid CoA-transferase subunit B [Rickettsia parkeri]AFC75087.1 Succinyl-CoA:3-ketoacid-coenzyme A transferase subunit B [Rickettsia parkeri str. Portsmouth]KJV94752.1 3-oxoacid CoA-transferase, B subunit [Rickettsia parkeri str. Grand Bay]KJV96328.1 3-oxoacid CoA-transferase, B subunit [Rickettsia parkeri str. AT\